MGEHTDSDSNSFVPKPILCLHSTVAARCYDVSGVGAGSDLSEEENNVPEESLEMANEPAIQSGNMVLKVWVLKESVSALSGNLSGLL